MVEASSGRDCREQGGEADKSPVSTPSDDCEKFTNAVLVGGDERQAPS